jgi:CDP-glycerol glycerophosphotransferase (TagB/SpsB family)
MVKATDTLVSYETNYGARLLPAKFAASQVLARMRKIARATFTLAAFYSSKFQRRDPRLWVFGSKRGFDGNSHYLFLWVAHNEPEIEAVWITADPSIADEIRSAGLKSEVRGTPSARRVLRRAGVYIYNSKVSDVGATESNGALLVNLWHGSGLKNIASHNKTNILYDLRNKGRLNGLRAKLVRIEQSARAVFISTSHDIAVRFSEAYGAPLTNCPIVGTPRLDASINKQLRAWSKQFGTYAEFEVARKNNREMYVYMPTVRSGDREFLKEALPDPERLSAVLRARSAVMFLKLHPRDEARHRMADSSWAGFDERILPWPRDAIFYNVMHEIDCLITDYSSVMFDFIAIKSAGLLLYPFDIDRYVDERGFYFPYAESVAGHRANKFSELCDAIASGRAIAEIDPCKLAKVRARVWDGSKLPASPDVTDEIKRRAGLRGRKERQHISRASGLSA